MGYVAYNRLLTSISSAQEYSSYATHRKPLRTSYPTGEQRSKYWLQLPYRFSIPFMIVSVGFHYLASLALFFAKFLLVDGAGEDAYASVMMGLGVSTAAVTIIAICVFVLLATAVEVFHMISFFPWNITRPFETHNDGADGNRL